MHWIIGLPAIWNYILNNRESGRKKKAVEQWMLKDKKQLEQEETEVILAQNIQIGGYFENANFKEL